MFQAQSPLVLPPLNGAPPHERAIVATLLYYDLFSYPLRADELMRFAPGAATYCARDIVSCNAWWDSCEYASPETLARETFWFLKGRTDSVQRRAQRQAVSVEKLKRACKYARLLQLVPGVRYVGVTGSLAMSSAVPEDDIDFLVITQKNRLWLTRALVLAALLAWGVKRPDDGGTEYPNLICANIFIAQDDLNVPDANLFIAHEICQMLPLVGKETYRAFLDANAWVRNFLPQWQPASVSFQDNAAWRNIQRAFEFGFANPLGARLEQQFAQRQLARIHSKHARGHNLNIRITPTQLRFHARDLSDYVVNTYNARWKELNQST